MEGSSLSEIQILLSITKPYFNRLFYCVLPVKFSGFITLSIMKGLTDIKEKEFTDVLEDIDEPFHLIVWNDDVNTFEWVIETLMEICKHSYEQAEQCAYIIHFKGKYAVKHGTYEDLKPMCDAITDRGIGATLETVRV
jgi:ATP-dependent Clp protease adaptor protein ClpS